MKHVLLSALLITVALTAFTNTLRADQTVTVTTTVRATSYVTAQPTDTCLGPTASYVQALEILLLLVLLLAAVVAIFLIRLYRKTRF